MRTRYKIAALAMLLSSPLLAQDLCQDVAVDDALGRSVPMLSKPNPLQSYVDPSFGSQITRISNAGFGGVVKPVYNTIQAWNADESRLLLYHTGSLSAGHYIYDANTYQLIKRLDIQPPDLEQVFWDHADPNLLYFVNVHQNGLNDGTYLSLIRFNVISDDKEILHNFADVCSSFPTGGNDIQMMSANSDVIGLRCDDSAGNKRTFNYRISTDTVSPLFPLGGAFSLWNAAQAAPSGNRLYLDGRVLDTNMQILRTLDLGNAAEHASLGRFANGDDGYFAVAFDPSPNTCNGHPDNGVAILAAHNMQDGSCRVIISAAEYGYPLSGIHPSAVGINGWVALSAIGYGQFDLFASGATAPPLFSEIFLTSTNNTSNTCRLAHHRSYGKSATQGGYAPYFGEPHPVISRSGHKIVFASDWYDSGSVDTYVIELPLSNHSLLSDSFED